jgi:hypothetical protein
MPARSLIDVEWCFRMKLMMKYMHIVIVDLSAPMKMFDVFSNFQFIQEPLQLKGFKVIYLPSQQNVIFSSNNSLCSVLRRSGINKTMLTEWFDCNKKYAHARELY